MGKLKLLVIICLSLAMFGCQGVTGLSDTDIDGIAEAVYSKIENGYKKNINPDELQVMYHEIKKAIIQTV